MTKTADTTTTTDAAGAAAAATGDAAAPAHVESGVHEDGEGDEDGEADRPTREQYDTCVTDLTRLDLRCRAEGHTLVDVLATAAKNAYGIDVR